jgi:hypothetical protein
VKVKDCTEGSKIGRLTVLSKRAVYVDRPSGRAKVWLALCRCDCGTTKELAVGTLGHTVSCGCFRKECGAVRGALNRTPYGKASYPRAQHISINACYRCRNPNAQHYKWYGARGIEFRFSSSQEMTKYIVEELEHGGERWDDPRYTIDRIDNNGHYERGNLQWATYEEQAQNRRRPERKAKQVSG